MKFDNMERIKKSREIFTALTNTFGDNFADTIVTNIGKSIALKIEKQLMESGYGNYIKSASKADSIGSIARAITKSNKTICSFDVLDSFKKYNSSSSIGGISVSHTIIPSYGIHCKVLFEGSNDETEVYEYTIEMKDLNEYLHNNTINDTAKFPHGIAEDTFVTDVINKIHDIIKNY